MQSKPETIMINTELWLINSMKVLNMLRIHIP